jgi:predicted alpha/beta-fold hydrolase
MPVIASHYVAPFPFKNCHVNTTYKTLFYRGIHNYKRERLVLSDGDFIDLDFSEIASQTLVIVLHGLEGSSQSKYVQAAVKYLNAQQYACAAVNFRGCSGEDNNKPYAYHSGKTDDLQEIITYIINSRQYKNIVLLGYSMGGNIILKYLGERQIVPSEIKCAITLSVPCDLGGSSQELAKPVNWIYNQRFLMALKQKMNAKRRHFSNQIATKTALEKVVNFYEFDNVVTAPLFGFKDASDYYKQSSSKQFLPSITLPTLLINALDDTFLSQSCYPEDAANKNNHLFLEMPKYGGHVGFNTQLSPYKSLWSERRIAQFIAHNILEN